MHILSVVLFAAVFTALGICLLFLRKIPKQSRDTSSSMVRPNFTASKPNLNTRVKRAQKEVSFSLNELLQKTEEIDWPKDFATPVQVLAFDEPKVATSEKRKAAKVEKKMLKDVDYHSYSNYLRFHKQKFN